MEWKVSFDRSFLVINAFSLVRGESINYVNCHIQEIPENGNDDLDSIDGIYAQHVII